ncbi:MAG: hypothetical protein NVV74_18310 [Magnetospirillum sp.]|nr:hypothetical protein [Magnetospirillum sp.]
MRRLALAAALALPATLALPAAGVHAGDGLQLALPEREEWLEMAESILAENARAAAGLDPLAAPMVLCQEAGCRQTGRHSLNAEEITRLRALFQDSEAGGTEERRRIGKAVALLETVMGARNGTWRDHPGNEHDEDDEAGQLDCIAESVNTRTYLDRMEQAGLLRHHQVAGFIHRYTVVLQHVAVEIVSRDEDEDGARFAVDSWVGANGEEPEILPYSQWRLEWGV